MYIQLNGQDDVCRYGLTDIQWSVYTFIRLDVHMDIWRNVPPRM